MAKVGNIKSGAESDIQEVTGQPSGGGYAGGRKASTGGMKGTVPADRAGCLAHKAAFRSGSQDARKDNGPKSASKLQLKTRRQGAGLTRQKPAASGAGG